MFASYKRRIENVTTKYSENDVGKSSKKTGYFTVSLTIWGKGEGGSATLANFDLFFSMEYDSIILKTHLIPVRGLKIAFLMPPTPLLYRFLTVL